MNCISPSLLILILFLMSSSEITPQSYLPLEVGNKWIVDYNSCSGSPVYTTGCRKDTVTYFVLSDSLMPNGFRYFKVFGIYLGFYEWFRSDTNYIYSYIPSDTLEIPLYNLKSKVGDTLFYSDNIYQYTVLGNRYYKNIFNKNTEVLAFVLETGLDMEIFLAISKDFGFLRFGDNGYGGFSYSNLIGCIINGKEYGFITDVESDKKIIPDKIELSQNYPNPFNPTTKIKYQIPSNIKGGIVNVELTVYDILGNKVATLVNEHKTPGYYEVEFNAGKLASGVYIYRLKAGSFIATKKLMLMK